jgi:hypothetical protein
MFWAPSQIAECSGGRAPDVAIIHCGAQIASPHYGVGDGAACNPDCPGKGLRLEGFGSSEPHHGVVWGRPKAAVLTVGKGLQSALSSPEAARDGEFGRPRLPPCAPVPREVLCRIV